MRHHLNRPRGGRVGWLSGARTTGWLEGNGRKSVPELPEVESARAVIERGGLRRRIADVDDSDAYVCRPHVPGEIRHALLGG